MKNRLIGTPKPSKTRSKRILLLYVYLVLCCYLTVVILTTILTTSPWPMVPVMFYYNKKPIWTLPEFYSEARGDRSGAAIHDMLMAHAYAYHHNKTYLGPCFVKFQRLPTKKEPRPATLQLLETIGFDKLFHYACPETVKMEKTLSWTGYREYENQFLTLDWRQHVRSVILDDETRTSSNGSSSTNDKVCNIVVHIRRGDVNPCKFSSRYLPNSYYQSLIDLYMTKILQSADNMNTTIQVTIFSESKTYESLEEDFRMKRNYTLYLDTPDLSFAWKTMINADVLIISKSSFSFVPAIFNANTVVYTPFWHNPLPEWIVVDSHNSTKQILQDAESEVEQMVKDCPLVPKKSWSQWLLKKKDGLSKQIRHYFMSNY